MSEDQGVYLLRVRYTVEYTVAVEGPYSSAVAMARQAPSPTVDDEHPAFTSFLTDGAKQCGALVGDITDIEVCGGYVDIESEYNDIIDRLDF